MAANNPNGNFIELDAVTLNIDKKFNRIYSNKVLIFNSILVLYR